MAIEAAAQIYRNFIGGAWMPSRSATTVPNVNPADTIDVLGMVPLSTREEARAAIDAAARAFPAWSRTPAPARGKILFAAVRRLEERKEELARALTLEEGKTLAESRGEVQRATNIVEFCAGEARRIAGETLPSELPHNFVYTLRQPLGPIAAITPWNFPVAVPIWKIAPALVAGNTVVFKPATLTPYTATLIVDVFREAGLPPGVLNLVIGSGREVGDELATNQGIRAITFTGSNDVGSGLYAAGAARGIKCQCEMGGKNPLVVLEDADLDLAADGTAQGAFGSTGQRCTATSRAIVVDSVAEAFVAKILDRAARVVCGNGLNPQTTMGPSVDEQQMNTVVRYLEIGRQEGARLRCGGTRLRDGDLGRGFFVAPTVFDCVTPSMRIAREEIFGPVLSVIHVRDFEEALAVANGVRYGLSASIYTNDASRVFKFSEGVEAGIVHVNSPTVGGEAHVPFGGIKDTGVGQREVGHVALDFFTELKVVYVDYTGTKRTGNLY